MKQIQLIAAALCLIMITTVGAGVVVAKQLAPVPSLPEKVYQFDVTYQGRDIGKLSVNTNTWMYVFNGKGLDPTKTYYLLAEGKTVSSGKATVEGTLHLQGAWDPNTADLPEPQTSAFTLVDAPLARTGDVTYTLTWYCGNGWWQGYATAHNTVTGENTVVQGTVYFYYWSDPTPGWWKWDGKWVQEASVHTYAHPEYYYYNFEMSSGGDASCQLKAVMHPDDPTIPQFWAYPSSRQLT